MIIKDEILNPFSIYIGEASFDLIEEKIPDTEGGKPYNNTLGYFNSVESALSKVVKIKLARNEKVVSLREFIDETKSLHSDFKKLITV